MPDIVDVIILDGDVTGDGVHQIDEFIRHAGCLCPRRDKINGILEFRFDAESLATLDQDEFRSLAPFFPHLSEG